MKDRIKNSLLICILLFLCIFLWQSKFNFFHFIPLNATPAKKEKPTFNNHTWFSGEYQKQYEEFFNEEFGFRSLLVKFNHEIDFLCFKRAHASWVIVGKNNYIYESGYIDAYYGRDFIGEEKIHDYLRKIKQIQDTLKKRNKLFLLVFAAGKASFYPEFIPDKFKTKDQPTNYKVFSATAKELQIDCIDFNKFFMEQKGKSKYPLYPQYGIHWSNYGAVNAFDSIVHYTENKLSISLPKLTIQSYNVTDTLRSPDNDLIQGMNLLWQPPSAFKMAYPNYTIKYDSTKQKKLNSLVVSDSFWWYIYGLGLQDSIFKRAEFWYYNKEMHPNLSTVPLNVINSNYFDRLRNSDVIILMHTEATLSKFGNGFVDMCYETFCQKQDTIKEKIQRKRELLVRNGTIFSEIKKRAKDQNIPLDTAIYLNAKWMVENKK